MNDGRITILYFMKGIVAFTLILFSFACSSASDNEIEQLKKQIDLQQNEINELKSNTNSSKDNIGKAVNSSNSFISVPMSLPAIPQVSESTSTPVIPSLTVPLPGGAVMPVVPLPIPSPLPENTPFNPIVETEKAIEEIFKTFVNYNLTEELFRDIEYEDAEVLRVIDGDTIELTDGRKIRYLGVDTPEKNECFYHQATLKNTLLVMTGNYNRPNKVRLYKGKVDKDRYGRYLRYVTAMGPGEEILVNDYLIKWGYGLDVSGKYSNQQLPNIQSLFEESSKEAQGSRVGLWENCREN
tara:strand:- start:2283 stop:3173 length:891 start_codon:yes stop_codon:yes gene_type:complete